MIFFYLFITESQYFFKLENRLNVCKNCDFFSKRHHEIFKCYFISEILKGIMHIVATAIIIIRVTIYLC
jgi:hypothetical protein